MDREAVSKLSRTTIYSRSYMTGPNPIQGLHIPRTFNTGLTVFQVATL